jgi:hypothetical protein
MGTVDVPQGITATALTVQGQFVEAGFSRDRAPIMQRTDLILDGATIRARQHTHQGMLVPVPGPQDGVLGGLAIDVSLTAVTVKGPTVSRSEKLGPSQASGMTTTVTRGEIVLDGNTILVRSFESVNKKPATEQTIDVMQELRQLRKDVKDLQTKLAALPGQGG